MIREKIVPFAWLLLAAIIIGGSVGFFMRDDVIHGRTITVPASQTPSFCTPDDPPKVPACWVGVHLQ